MKNCSVEVKKREMNVLPEDSLGACCALLLLHGCSLSMSPYAGGHLLRGLPEVDPDITELLALETLHKASLSSVYLFLYGHMVKAI